MGAVSSLPVGHVIKVLCELRQVGALLFILLFCPKQNFWYLPRKKNRGVAEHHTSSWDFCLRIPSCSLWPWSFADTSSAVLCIVLGIPEIAEGCVQVSPSALPPSLSSYLDFIEEFSIQEGQLLGYFMTVEIMQGPRPAGKKDEERI